MKNRLQFASVLAAAAFLGATGCVAQTADGNGERSVTNEAAAAAGVAETGRVAAWNSADGILTIVDTTVVNPALSTLNLKANAGTIRGVEDPDELPPGPCRAFAEQWSIYTVQLRSADWFSRLLSGAADYTCDVQFVRSDVANADGSFDLIEIAPAP